ncbi:NAD(P)-dependent oxidoreductase [Salicibibacter cibi]|uniref:NAD(P)-dependent oxidoreductase n=1 Tax=Salicibibacter cibi TaxID=2743001 RepID=A0A7T6Z8G0_9BACI|nr:NAD(P)-dependent oxidoreductase [Salicibibacter cibi]QQK78868.1 NAD(P)-dependent oxidoreductase [Salicibibacter cibi]
MNVLVTGSSGLIGASLVKGLADEGFKVIGYDKFSNNAIPHKDYKFEEGDLCDFPRLASVIKKYKIDSIIHCGGMSHPQVGAISPYNIVQTNIVGTTNVFESARLFNVKKVVYISSGAVYGKNQLCVTKETDQLNPTTIYGVSKVTGEQIAAVFASNYGVESISLRLAFVYGPNRLMPDPLKMLLSQAIAGENIYEEKGADQKLEFIYIKDVVTAIKKALILTNLKHNVFNIGSGVNDSLMEVISVIRGLFPNISIEIGKGDFGYDRIGAFDCSRAKEELGFSPNYSLKEGIRDYAKFLKEYQNQT